MSSRDGPRVGRRPNLRASDSSIPGRTRSVADSLRSIQSDLASTKRWKHSNWRHAFGLFFLVITVLLWTASNFLASTIFADNTYSKPFFVTYTNSSFFLIPLVPALLRRASAKPEQLAEVKDYLLRRSSAYTALPTVQEEVGRRASQIVSQGLDAAEEGQELTLLETIKLSFGFCFLWFVANYLSAGCLEYTTVSSATILTSTSSIWTLLFGTLIRVEHFTFRKLLGVLASLLGIILISTVDVSGGDDEDRGSFPYKSPAEIAVGDIMAILGAVLYGIYAVVMKKRIGDENRVDMPLFFGFVGLLNVVLLWPGFFVMHVLGVEQFQMPSGGKVLTIILLNSSFSLISDFCWAFSMLLIGPLIVTVGLSMTIPLSLVGQMLLDNQYSSFMYWVGACIVVLSFIFINNEEARDERDTSLHEDIEPS